MAGALRVSLNDWLSKNSRETAGYSWDVMQEALKQYTELEKLYVKKQQTPITKELLLKHGFTKKDEGGFALKGFGFDLEWGKDCYWADTILHNVAELEDALELSCIDLTFTLSTTAMLKT